MPAGEESEMAVALAMFQRRDRPAAARTSCRADFVANASHEIRTPLATLSGCIETLRGPARDDAQARERFLGMMDDQGQRMAMLVEDLLSLSRIELREHSRPTGEIDIGATLERLRTSFLFDAGEKAMTNRARRRGRTAPDQGRCRGGGAGALQPGLERHQVRQPGTAVTVSAGAVNGAPEHLHTAHGRLVWIAVADRGDGIAAHHLPRLTERFYRVDTARARELGGTGLGLAIVKHVLNRHRGELHVESRPGAGSTFTVWLPAA